MMVGATPKKQKDRETGERERECVSVPKTMYEYVCVRV